MVCAAGQLATFSLAKLDGLFGESNARWLHNLARGFDEEEVKPLSMLCGSACCSRRCRYSSSVPVLQQHSAVRDLSLQWAVCPTCCQI